MTTNTEPPADVVEARGQNAAFDRVLNHLNTIDTEGMNADEVRRHIYGEVAAMKPHPLSAQPAPSQSGLAEVHKELDEGSGFWHICSGCSGTDNPYSTVYRCDVGMGCNECGGIGVCWDDTDYQAFASTDRTDNQPALGMEALADNIDWLDCKIEKLERTNNQPAPDDGLVVNTSEAMDIGRFREHIAGQLSAALIRYRVGTDREDSAIELAEIINDEWEYILSALTAKDHTALPEVEVLERAIDRMGWPEIHAFQNELRKGQDVREDGGGFMIRAIKALFGIRRGDPVENYQQAARRMIDQALATKGDG